MTAPTEPTVRATQYDVCCLPEDNINHGVYAITVEYRGRNLWAVKRFGQCLSTDGEWDYESRPSEREDEWLAAHRFDLDAALRLAKEQTPKVTVNGFSAADALARAEGGRG